MQASNAPSKSAVPFAESGTKNTIPVASQIGVTPGRASFTDGFPPLTMTPPAAGGVPPRGADFNGILNFLSAGMRWNQAGGGYTYDSAFATAVGGYPKGAVVLKAGGNGYWICTAENNSSNPDSGGAGWTALPEGIATVAQAQAMTDDANALTPLKLGSAFAGVNTGGVGNIYYQIFPGTAPNRLMVQWGVVITNAASLAPVTFPLAFATAPLVFGATHSGSGTLFVTLTTRATTTGAQFTAWLSNGAGGGAYQNINFMAIGRV